MKQMAIFIKNLKYFSIHSNGSLIIIESVEDFNLLKFCYPNGSVFEQKELINYPINFVQHNIFLGKKTRK